MRDHLPQVSKFKLLSRFFYLIVYYSKVSVTLVLFDEYHESYTYKIPCKF